MSKSHLLASFLATCCKYVIQISHWVETKINTEQLLKEWKELIIVAIYKKGDEIDCSNYRAISLLSTMYKIL